MSHLLAFCLASLLAPPTAATARVDAARPWLVHDTFRVRVEAHAKEFDGDPAAKLAHARWCREVGAFGGMAEALGTVTATEQLDAATAAQFGFVPVDGKLQPEESARFEGAAPAVAARFSGPSDRARRDLLKDRFRDIRLANKSTYFDLWTDLDSRSLEIYTATLNDFYRQLKNRFRAYLTTNIDVILFASRSDYLIDYARGFGKSGEHILGYYVPSRRRLVFYDDREGLEEVIVTAKHECTHLIVDLGYRGADIPPWLNEGLACFLAADGVEARGVYTAGLILEVQQALASGRRQELDELFEVNSEKLKYEHYAWSWSLLQFLHQTGRERAFGEFLDVLRTRLEGVEPRDVSERVATTFTDVFGADTEGLGREWWDWLRDELRLERPDQFLDLARASLKRARSQDAGRERDHRLDTAELALRSVTDAALDPERRLLWWECVIARAEQSDDPLAHRLLMRALRDEFRSLPADARRADLALRAVTSFADAAGVSRPSRGVFDVRDALVKRAEKAHGGHAAELQAGTVVADELTGLAFDALGERLEEEPADRGAAQSWLRLAMDVAPTRLAEIVPTLRLMVELDPDDRNLASLGVAYHGLGRTAYGKTLVEEATSRSLRPGLVAEYRTWVGLSTR